jgi:hypothetical protein
MYRMMGASLRMPWPGCLGEWLTFFLTHHIWLYLTTPHLSNPPQHCGLPFSILRVIGLAISPSNDEPLGPLDGSGNPSIIGLRCFADCDGIAQATL